MTITINCVQSANGKAPLHVQMDFSGTTATGVTAPFKELLFQHNAGVYDGTWDNGAFPMPRNYIVGPVASFIYEEPGTYTWTTIVNSETETATATYTIVVSAFDAADTICISAQEPAPTPGVNGAPIGATCVVEDDLPTIISTYWATNKRVLLQRGDTFTGAANTSLAVTGPAMLGAFGVGAEPKVMTTGTTAGDRIFRLTGVVSDVRLVDLDLDGDGNGNRQGIDMFTAGEVSKLTLLRLKIHDIGAGVEIPLQQAAAVPDMFAMHDCSIQRILSTGSPVATHGLLIGANNVSIKGNLFDDSTAASAEHLLRLQFVNVGCVSNNTIQDVAEDKEMIALRAPCSDEGVCPSGEFFGSLGLSGANAATRKVVVSWNLISTNTYAGIIVGQVNSGDSTLINNIIIENNYSPSTITGGIMVGIHADDSVVRNNLGTIDANGVDPRLVSVTGATAGMAVSDGVDVLNNTFYSQTALNSVRVVNLGAGVTNVSVINNLAYAPNSTGGDMVFDAGAITPTVSNNTTSSPSGGQMRNTNPFVSGALENPIDFRISPDSYAASGGTAVFPSSNSDFFNCDDGTANERIGAFVPRVRAQCRGVAGS